VKIQCYIVDSQDSDKHNIRVRCLSLQRSFLCVWVPVPLLYGTLPYGTVPLRYDTEQVRYRYGTGTIPVRYGTVRYITVPYRTALYRTVLYSTVLYGTVLYCTVLFRNPYRTVRYKDYNSICVHYSIYNVRYWYVTCASASRPVPYVCAQSLKQLNNRI